jgi:transposase
VEPERLPGPGRSSSPYLQGWAPVEKESQFECRWANLYVGIDVSKATLDVAILPTREHFVVSNDEAGIDELLGRLAKVCVTLVVLEASGGFERPVAAALLTSQNALFVVDPPQARDFAKATGQRAKTDALDAFVLARFAEAIRPTPIPDAQAGEFREILAKRRQIIGMLTAEKNRLGTTAASAPVREWGLPFFLTGVCRAPATTC